MKSVHWKAVLTFYGIALLISSPLRLHLVPILGNYQNYLSALGPAIAGVLCLFIFRKSHVRLNTLFGTSIKFSLLFTIIPFIGFAIVGFPNGIGNSLYVCIYIFIYCLLEEMGWRGFLQDALEPLKPARRYLLIGILWELWHLRFLSNSLTLPAKLMLLGSTIAGSYGIGKVTETTRSVISAAWIHMLFNIIFEIKMPQQEKILLIIYLIIAWTITFIIWLKYNNTKHRPDEQRI